MEVISVLRVLRRHRLLAAAGLIPAVLAALALQFQVSLTPPNLASKQRESGLATARVLLAAPQTPAFDLDSEITDTLATRARLLADLLATDDVRGQIARDAGIDPEKLLVMGPAMGPPQVPLPLAISATEASVAASEPYVVLVSVSAQVPIISFRAAAPDAASAVAVVNAATAGLDELIAGKSTGGRELQVEPLGPAAERTLADGPKVQVAVIAAAMLFLLWCAAIVVVAGLAHQWRAGRRRQSAPRYAPSA